MTGQDLLFIIMIGIFTVFVVSVLYSIATSDVHIAWEQCDSLGGKFNSYKGTWDCSVIEGDHYVNYRWLDGHLVREGS